MKNSVRPPKPLRPPTNSAWASDREIDLANLKIDDAGGQHIYNLSIFQFYLWSLVAVFGYVYVTLARNPLLTATGLQDLWNKLLPADSNIYAAAPIMVVGLSDQFTVSAIT